MYKICIIIYDYAPHSTGVWVLIYQAISSVTIVGKIQSHFIFFFFLICSEFCHTLK